MSASSCHTWLRPGEQLQTCLWSSIWRARAENVLQTSAFLCSRYPSSYDRHFVSYSFLVWIWQRLIESWLLFSTLCHLMSLAGGRWLMYSTGDRSQESWFWAALTHHLTLGKSSGSPFWQAALLHCENITEIFIANISSLFTLETFIRKVSDELIMHNEKQMHVKIKFHICSLVMQIQSDSLMRGHFSCWIWTLFLLFEHLHFYQTARFSHTSFQHAADISSFCTYNFINPKACIVKKGYLRPIFLSSSPCCHYHMQIKQRWWTSSRWWVCGDHIM